MKIFVLQIIDDTRARQYPNYSGCYSSTQGYAVLANSEAAARGFLATFDPYYKEGQGQWLDPLCSSCEEIIHVGMGTPRIILSDNPTG